MFDATTPKFRDISFEKIDIDGTSTTTADLKRKFNVTGIPRLVMLDANGNAVYNGGAPQSEDALASLINQHR